MNFDFLFQSSPWLIPVCLLVGGIYAFVLYQKSSSWNRKVNFVLAFLRFLVTSILCFLLLNFLLRQINRSVQKKTVVLAVDNSQSMTIAGQKNLEEIKQKVGQLAERLKEKEYDVSLASLDRDNLQDIDSLRFNLKSSNVSGLLSDIKAANEGKNLVDVLLISDGISNQGSKANSGKYNFAVHTIGVGDTIPKKDISIKSIYANKVAYLGNKFPIQADITAFGFDGKSVNVYLKQAGKILEKQSVTFKQKDDLKTVSFNATATQIGVQHLTIEVDILEGEFSTKNNRQEVYIEVIDGKEKILLLALAPHPDIKALKNIIEKNPNYELDIKILTQTPSPDVLSKNYNLLILHQLPDYFNSYSSIYKPLLDKNTPCLHVLGNQSGTNYLNQINQVLQINSNAGQSDKVTGSFNPNFKLMNFTPEQMEFVKKLPQFSVPFGEFKVLPNTEVLIYQKVGAAQTNKPLLAVSSGANKSAILAGEGLWTWRLEEFQLTDKQEVVDDIILKTLQFISAKDDKRKLRVYPINNEFMLGDKVIFETEIYNAIFEKLFDLPVKLEIRDEKNLLKSYSYTPTSDNSRFEISGLPQGLYRYKATSKVLGKEEQSTGEFVIKDVQLELQNLTADFDVLRSLSQNTGGGFFGANDFDKIYEKIISHQVPDKIDATEDLKEIVNLKWLFFLVLFLLTGEWVLRKYLGGY
jgi:hypothetical protein